MKTLFKILIVFLFFFLQCGGPFSPVPYRMINKENEFIPLNPKGMDEKTKKKFIKEILKFLDTPYRWGGYTERGTDCSGLVMTLYDRAANISLPHNTKEIYKIGTAVSTSFNFGDLIFFCTNKSNVPNHMGLYLAKGKFLHASVSRGVTIDNLKDKPYKNQVLGIKRIIK